MSNNDVERTNAFIAAAITDAREFAAVPATARTNARIFANVLAATPHAPQRSGWPVWQLALALTAIALIVALGFVARPRHTSEVTVAGSWLADAAGVMAWQEPGTNASFMASGDRVDLTLRSGTIYAQFTRAEAPGLLYVTTPSAVAIVRGTVFMVSVSESATAVGDTQGLVEVRSNDTSVFVEAGRTVTVPRAQAIEPAPALAPAPVPAIDEAPAVPRARENAAHHAARAGRRHSAHAAPAPAAPSSATADENPAGILAGTGSTSPRSADVIADARARLRGGDGQGAVSELEKAIAKTDERVDREEMLYALANIYRARREFDRASTTLQALASSSQSETARLASVERARLLAEELGNNQEARRILRRFIASGRRDALAEEAWLDLCVLELEAQSFDTARSCLDSFLHEFGGRSRAPKARELLRKLDEQRQ